MAITRLAPSPTGALHLGNARTFLVNWLMARQLEWKVVLRIEDLDGPRVKRGADREAIEDLRWLGLDWDEGPVYQSSRVQVYREAVERLVKEGRAYPCVCSRREVELAASAPHAEDGAMVYPGTCRGRFATVAEATAVSGRPPAIRFRGAEGDMQGGPSPQPSPGVPGEGEGEADLRAAEDVVRGAHPPLAGGVVTFDDLFCGRVGFDMAGLGDFVIAKADGTAAYQLAVVVDDAAMGVTHVVRGDDLLDSTPRQVLLYRALGLSDRIPAYCHLPLVVGADGRRLAKRHGDTRLSAYRQQGVSAGRVLKLLARWCGIDAPGVERAGDLVGRFDLCWMPKNRIVFTAGTLEDM